MTIRGPSPLTTPISVTKASRVVGGYRHRIRAAADESNPHFSQIDIRNGVLVLSGYGLRVAVERGQLVVADGIGRDRREARFSRATCPFKRLVILGHSGTISFEALRWLHDIGISLIQIDADGNVIVASARNGYDDARLRRAQALAAFTAPGLAITRVLLREKLLGQATVLTRLPDTDQAQAQIHNAVQQLEHVDTLNDLRFVEAQAAAVYWNAWSAVEVHFAKRDLPRVPEHWRTFGMRRSPVSGASRNAANPANALLNYLYAILEAETAIAAQIVGLDPGIGFLHADQRNRNSLACDLMESVRPTVDSAVLDMLLTHTFSARDFFENRQGVCRLLPPLTQLLAETAPQWAKTIAPVAEEVASSLMRASLPSAATHISTLMGSTSSRTPTARENANEPDHRILPTPLTQANRSAGRAGIRTSKPKCTPIPSPANLTVLPSACLSCGTLLEDATRQYCDGCLPAYRVEAIPAFRAGGPQVLRTLRADGNDPAHGGTAGEKRAQRVAERWREWRDASTELGSVDADANGPELDFERDILPHLANVSLAVMMEATGLSRRYCWLIKTGQKVPHQRHWAALRPPRGT